jgi:hypothetical protein
MGPIERLSQWLAPWESFYAGSTAVSIAVTAAHLLAMLWSGGLAIAADRATLRALRGTDAERDRQIRELDRLHRPILVALAVVFASGLLLAAADLATYAVSPAFWIKLGLVALLTANGAILARTGRALRNGDQVLWQRLRATSVASLVLWSLTLIAGVVLVDAA